MESVIGKSYQDEEELVFFNCDDTEEESIVDGVGIYLDRIGRVARLGASQEVDLAREIEAGLDAELLLEEDGVQDRGDIRELRQTARVGRRALETMVVANLRLVIPVATKYRGRGVPFSDLIQEGNLAVMEAAQKFDYLRGFKFSTYATTKIRERIIRSFYDQGRKNPLNRKDGESASKLSHAHRDLTAELMREPKIEEVASRMKLTIGEVQNLMVISGEPLSLEEPIDSSNGLTLIDTIKGKSDLEIKKPDTTRTSFVDTLLANLTEKREAVVRGLYGLDEDGTEKTYAELADRLRVTESCVRTLYRQAIKNLRDSQASDINIVG